MTNRKRVYISCGHPTPDPLGLTSRNTSTSCNTPPRNHFKQCRVVLQMSQQARKEKVTTTVVLSGCYAKRRQRSESAEPHKNNRVSSASTTDPKDIKMSNNTTSPNTTTQPSPSSSNITDYEIALQAFVLIVVLLVCVFGNSLVCYCVLTVRQLQIPTNYFIVSLASADLLFAVMCLPFRVLDILWRYAWKLDLAACKFWVWTDLLFCSASIANLAAISVDRYSKIAAPLTYDTRMTPRRVIITLIILWGYSCTLASLILVQWSDDPEDKARGVIVANQVCYCESKIFLIVICVIGFFAPLAIMLLMYCFVFKVAVGQARRLAQQHGSLYGRTSTGHKSARGRKGNILFEVKATKTLVILLSAFCVCWSPYFVLSLISLFSPEVFHEIPLWFNRLLKIVFVNLLPNINAALNPIIYTTHNVQFRKAVLKLMCERRRKYYNARNISTTESEEMTDFSRQSSLLRSITERFSLSAPASTETERM